MPICAASVAASVALPAVPQASVGPSTAPIGDYLRNFVHGCGRACACCRYVFGFLTQILPRVTRGSCRPFSKGLGENGYVDCRNVAIEYRWVENRLDRLPAMAADLLHRQVTVIAGTSTPAALQ